MNIHEYQAKELFEQFNVPSPKGRVAETAEQAQQIAEELSGQVVIKAQIHAGGRGKGGGVKLAKSIDEVRIISDEIPDGSPIETTIGFFFITLFVKKLYICILS